MKKINEIIDKYLVEYDMMGKKCKKCGEGVYKETSVNDDRSGTLHCSKCGASTKRHVDNPPEQKKESRQLKEAIKKFYFDVENKAAFGYGIDDEDIEDEIKKICKKYKATARITDTGESEEKEGVSSFATYVVMADQKDHPALQKEIMAIEKKFKGKVDIYFGD